jgi:predicted nucleotide-binding protein
VIAKLYVEVDRIISYWMKKYKRYKGLDGKMSEFSIFLIHGRSMDWKKVKDFIEDTLSFKVTVIIEEVGADTIISKLRKAIWKNSDCAIAIMSADDLMADNTKYARPNVLFEIGYTMGFFDHLYWEDDDLHPVLMLKEKETYIPSDLAGIEYMEYNKIEGIEKTFEPLSKYINKIFEQVKEYYKE